MCDRPVTSHDFLAADGDRLARKVQEEVELALGPRATSRTHPGIPPLREIDLYGT